MKSLAIGDWTQSPTPLTSMEVMLRWGGAEISNPLTTCLVSLGTPMSHLISINSGVVKVLWITLLSRGNSKGFKNSVPGNEDKGQIYLCVFLIIPQVDKKSTLNSLEGLLLKLKPQYFGHLIQRTDTGKDPDAGKAWRREEKGMAEDEIVGWHHRLNELEFEQAPEDGEVQGSLVCCSLWGCKESDTTERLKNNR